MAERRRRQYGTGSVYQRASDGRWIGTFQAGWTERGTRRVVTVSATTEAECKRRLTKRQREYEVDAGAVAGGHRTVKSWCEAWLEVHATKARPKYYATDASAVRRWIVPTIGSKRLDTLTPGDVRSVGTAVRKAGRSTTTARYVHGVLIRALDAAAADGHSVSRLAREVAAPGKATHDRDAVPLGHALAILGAASQRPDGSRWAAAFLQGMRQGECLGLTWEAVDLDRGLLDASWQLQALPYLDRAAGTFRVPDGYEARRLVDAMHLVRPKSRSGWRVIPLVSWMGAALETWQRAEHVNPHGLVWPVIEWDTTDPTLLARMLGRPRSSGADRDAWYALQAAAKVAPTDERRHRDPARYLLHEARHTTATLLLEHGVKEAVVIAIMGHSSITSTRGYQHVSQALARDALDGIAGALGLTATPHG
ncbi:tyrosine-type recombinase/integrase [Cellulomonas composti]|uniref:Putative phage integrase n=1 Tax=Cellulomonas composti TaxID=266130 RepID=A0A511JBP1_9CELL|nr:tyrosine-type recombinase/integrase [Cellulomonas composti]GEL95402.1 putative phage integrase [Cellulomonas composti]